MAPSVLGRTPPLASPSMSSGREFHKGFLPSALWAGLHRKGGLSTLFNHPSCHFNYRSEEKSPPDQLQALPRAGEVQSQRESPASRPRSRAATQGLVNLAWSLNRLMETLQAATSSFFGFVFLLLSKRLNVHSVNDEA